MWAGANRMQADEAEGKLAHNCCEPNTALIASTGVFDCRPLLLRDCVVLHQLWVTDTLHETRQRSPRHARIA